MTPTHAEADSHVRPQPRHLYRQASWIRHADTAAASHLVSTIYITALRYLEYCYAATATYHSATYTLRHVVEGHCATLTEGYWLSTHCRRLHDYYGHFGCHIHMMGHTGIRLRCHQATEYAGHSLYATYAIVTLLRHAGCRSTGRPFAATPAPPHITGLLHAASVTLRRWHCLHGYITLKAKIHRRCCRLKRGMAVDIGLLVPAHDMATRCRYGLW